MSGEDVGGCCWGYSPPCLCLRDQRRRRRRRCAANQRRRKTRVGSERRRLEGLKLADWSEGGLGRWGGVGSSTGGGATRAFPSGMCVSRCPCQFPLRKEGRGDRPCARTSTRSSFMLIMSSSSIVVEDEPLVTTKVGGGDEMGGIQWSWSARRWNWA